MNTKSHIAVRGEKQGLLGRSVNLSVTVALLLEMALSKHNLSIKHFSTFYTVVSVEVVVLVI